MEKSPSCTITGAGAKAAKNAGAIGVVMISDLFSMRYKLQKHRPAKPTGSPAGEAEPNKQAEFCTIMGQRRPVFGVALYPSL